MRADVVVDRHCAEENEMSDEEVIHGPWSWETGGEIYEARLVMQESGPWLQFRYHGEGPWHGANADHAAEAAATELARLSSWAIEREEHQEIHAELVGALATLSEEELQPCMPPSPGHLGGKALAKIREAREAWNALAAERDRLRALVARLTEAWEEDGLGGVTYRHSKWLEVGVIGGHEAKAREQEIRDLIAEPDCQAAETWLRAREERARREGVAQGSSEMADALGQEAFDRFAGPITAALELLSGREEKWAEDAYRKLEGALLDKREEP